MKVARPVKVLTCLAALTALLGVGEIVGSDGGQETMSSGSRLALFRDLLGPILPVAESSAMGGVFAKYDSDFALHADAHWADEGPSWENVNYYDRAQIYYAWAARTENPIYLERADAIAVNYRDDYVVANDYNVSAHWSQVSGVALHFLRTGDEASLMAVGGMADTLAAPYYVDNLSNTKGEMDNRQQARVLEAFLYASKLDAPSADGNEWDALLRSSLEAILASQDEDGAYRHAIHDGYVKPFMVGMLNDALIKYHSNFEADPRILAAVVNSLDYLWDHTWDAEKRAFYYLEGSSALEPTSDGGGITPAPDLNNMIVSGFGWVYDMTGDEIYRTRGEMIFSGGVDGAWLAGSKQFNESYTTSYKYLAFRNGGYAGDE